MWEYAQLLLKLLLIKQNHIISNTDNIYYLVAKYCAAIFPAWTVTAPELDIYRACVTHAFPVPKHIRKMAEIKYQFVCVVIHMKSTKG